MSEFAFLSSSKLFYGGKDTTVINKWMSGCTAQMVNAEEVIEVIKESGLDYTELNTSGWKEFEELNSKLRNYNVDKTKIYNLPNFIERLKCLVESMNV